MQVFFVLKFLQALACYAAIALSLAPTKLCGRTPLDLVLSNSETACAKLLYSTGSDEVVRLLNGDGKLNDSNSSALNGTTSDVLDSSHQADSRFQSFTCIHLSWSDFTCFTWLDSERRTVCEALSFALILPLVLAVEFVYILYTIFEVLFLTDIPPMSKDRRHAVVQICAWSAALYMVGYRAIRWDSSWSSMPFIPAFPSEWYSVLCVCAFCATWFAFEISYAKWLHMDIKLKLYPGLESETEQMEMPYIENLRSFRYSLEDAA